MTTLTQNYLKARYNSTCLSKDVNNVNIKETLFSKYLHVWWLRVAGGVGSQGKRGVITRVCIESIPMNRCNLCVSLLYFVLAILAVFLVFLVTVSAYFFLNLKYYESLYTIPFSKTNDFLVSPKI